VRAVIAESYERIHRSNLVGMGILPLQYKTGESRETLGLTGKETFEITGVTALAPRIDINVATMSDDGNAKQFTVVARVDTPEEVAYYQNGGILTYVLRQMI
jgi:aconitate hydratase